MEKSFHKCRLCLKLGVSNFCSIYEAEDTIKLSQMVMTFANIQIYEGDGLPEHVCTSCIENLSTAYSFKLQCEKTDGTLRKSANESDLYTTAIDQTISGNDANANHMENKENYNNETKKFENYGRHFEVSDETDSDIESVKCVYCNGPQSNRGAHKCHVTCTIERDTAYTSSSETLVASDPNPPKQELPLLTSSAPSELPSIPEQVLVPCVLCDAKFDDYDAYVFHVNKCTANVKLHHYVCPICHEIYTEKMIYLHHLKDNHFNKNNDTSYLTVSEDCVDNFVSITSEKTRRPTSVRRQIGWSIEDIYQEIDCKPIEKETPSSSPMKAFFKFGNESFSRQSTPKKVSFQRLLENGKSKTSSYFPIRKYFDSFKKKANAYSPLKGKMTVTTNVKASLPEIPSDSDYYSPSGTSEESWKMKQNLICACDKKIFMISDYVHDRQRLVAMISELGGVVAENTKMEMLATHFIAMLPNDTLTGMMVCALATGKWVIHVNYVYDSFRYKKFLDETTYEWKKSPKMLELDKTSVEVSKAAVFWHLELQALSASFPFEGKQVVLIMRKKYRQYYQMIFKALKAKPITYDPRTPGSCCSADYCFVDMKIIERVKLRFFEHHNVPVFPYQYILIYLLNKGHVADEQKYLLQDCNKYNYQELDFLNKTF